MISVGEVISVRYRTLARGLVKPPGCVGVQISYLSLSNYALCWELAPFADAPAAVFAPVAAGAAAVAPGRAAVLSAPEKASCTQAVSLPSVPGALLASSLGAV